LRRNQSIYQTVGTFLCASKILTRELKNMPVDREYDTIKKYGKNIRTNVHQKYEESMTAV
jgi:hypothetical protein